jgi:hypothetical protein
MTRIYETSYKDVFAVAVETEFLKALFLPLNGAKLTSLTDKITGTELLATAGGEKYKPITLTGSYVDSECSAFDDMFPTIDPYTPKTGIKAGISYIDHGEVCRSRFDYIVSEDDLVMIFKSESLDYRYTKTVTGTPDGSVSITYRIENLTDEPFDYLWAGHLMLAAAEGSIIIAPYPDCAPAEIMFDDFQTYGVRGDHVEITSDMLTSAAFSPVGDAYKFYFTEPVPLGLIKYVSPATGRTFVMRYDEKRYHTSAYGKTTVTSNQCITRRLKYVPLLMILRARRQSAAAAV